MGIKVYDADGEERTLDWALEKYNFAIVGARRDVDHWEIVELHEQIGPSSMTVRTQPPTEGILVAFGWPDGQVFQKTNEDGQTGFGMGEGAYYHPDKGESGPHFILLQGRISDLIRGLGMIAGTNHAHIEPTFSFVGAGEPEPEPEPGPKQTFKIRFEGVLTIE